MRYQPLHAKRKNEYISPNWTYKELADYMRYYARLNMLGFMPFEEYQGSRKATDITPEQMTF
jgi:hypothetical protein